MCSPGQPQVRRSRSSPSPLPSSSKLPSKRSKRCGPGPVRLSPCRSPQATAPPRTKSAISTPIRRSSPQTTTSAVKRTSLASFWFFLSLPSSARHLLSASSSLTSGPSPRASRRLPKCCSASHRCWTRWRPSAADEPLRKWPLRESASRSFFSLEAGESPRDGWMEGDDEEWWWMAETRKRIGECGAERTQKSDGRSIRA